ncbi:MAG: single-stranded DNA-binding protein [Desulfovibrio sp.]|nr:single-stranded DNA-binding protein [Desulfovibrio sp.]
MLNKVMIIGRLGADPELKYTQSGSPATSLSIATDETYTDRDGNRVERTEWHRVRVFQRQAENCANYLKKGSLVYVEGSLQTRKWQDQQGQDRYTTEIRAQRVQFLDRRGDGGQGEAPRHEGAPRRAPRPRLDNAPGQDGGYEAPTGGSEAADGGYGIDPFPPAGDTGMDKVPF